MERGGAVGRPRRRAARTARLRLRPPETLEAERESLRDVVLVGRLESALKKLNPWISDDNLHKAVRAVTSVQAASLIEANEDLYTALSYGIALEQDLGEGRKSQQVRFFDFDAPDRNDFLVTRQYKVKGAKKHIIPDVVCFVNGIPLVVIECKSPSLGDAGRPRRSTSSTATRRGARSTRSWARRACSRAFSSTSRPAARTRSTARSRPRARFYLRWKQPYPMTSPRSASSSARTSRARRT